MCKVPWCHPHIPAPDGGEADRCAPLDTQLHTSPVWAVRTGKGGSSRGPGFGGGRELAFASALDLSLAKCTHKEEPSPSFSGDSACEASPCWTAQLSPLPGGRQGPCHTGSCVIGAEEGTQQVFVE